MWLTFQFCTTSGCCIYFFLSTLCILRQIIRRKKLALPLLKRVWPKPQTGKRRFQNVSITIIPPHRMLYEKDDNRQPGCGRRAACCCKSGACRRNTWCRKEKRVCAMGSATACLAFLTPMQAASSRVLMLMYVVALPPPYLAMIAK